MPLLWSFSVCRRRVLQRCRAFGAMVRSFLFKDFYRAAFQPPGYGAFQLRFRTGGWKTALTRTLENVRYRRVAFYLDGPAVRPYHGHQYPGETARKTISAAGVDADRDQRVMVRRRHEVPGPGVF